MKSINNFNYAVLLTHDNGGGYVVTCRDLPEVITQGETVAGALIEAVDALDECFALRMEDNLEFPTPTKVLNGEYSICPPIETQIKAFLYLALRESNITKTELAKRLRVNEKSVRRMLDPHYTAKLPRMAQAMEALGKRLVIMVE